ncbi:microtubule-associated protein 1S-like, partial [Egretta garzetta]|uniref:microtubule-associated protein 1S-like n=1 Tax=Egretta garzetta TaxID=188379 RepID=UPI00163BBC00
MKDPCPIPAQPGICMVDPEALPAEQTRAGKKEPPGKVKRTPSRVGSAPTAPRAEAPRHPALAPKARGPNSSARDTGDKAKLPLGDKKGPSGGDTRTPGTTRGAGFFRRIRSFCYVVSGDDHLKEGVLRSLLDALLAGKHQWGTNIQ